MEINHVNSILLLVLMPLAILVLLRWGHARTHKRSANGAKTWLWPYFIGYLVFVPYAAVGVVKYSHMLTSGPLCRNFSPSVTGDRPVESHSRFYPPPHILYHNWSPWEKRPICPEDKEAYDRYVAGWNNVREQTEKEQTQQNTPENLEENP